MRDNKNKHGGGVSCNCGSAFIFISPDLFRQQRFEKSPIVLLMTIIKIWSEVNIFESLKLISPGLEVNIYESHRMILWCLESVSVVYTILFWAEKTCKCI